MSAALSGLIGNAPTLRRVQLAWVLVDETFGLTINAARDPSVDLVSFKSAADLTSLYDVAGFDCGRSFSRCRRGHIPVGDPGRLPAGVPRIGGSFAAQPSPMDDRGPCLAGLSCGRRRASVRVAGHGGRDRCRRDRKPHQMSHLVLIVLAAIITFASRSVLHVATPSRRPGQGEPVPRGLPDGAVCGARGQRVRCTRWRHSISVRPWQPASAA